MLFQREGIRDVRGVVLPDGVDADGRFAGVSRSALVTWQSGLKGKLFQAYVNGRFAGVTFHPDQRRLVLQAPASFEAAVRVEIIAVSPDHAHADFGKQLSRAQPDRERVTLTFLRSQGLPSGSRINIYSDAGGAPVDYNTPINATPIPVWPCREDKAGFGMAMFGDGDLGLDSAACVGFGKGGFGWGGFGMDADTIEWISPPLAAGRYRFGVVVIDDRGNVSPPSEVGPISVMPPARPAASVSVAEVDPQANCLTLTISDHA